LDCGDDALKEKYFINSPNFDLFRTTAIKHGFHVSLMCPWILIADPMAHSDSEMTNYLANNNIINNNLIYNQLYNRLFLGDITRLRNMLKNAYNTFVERYPYSRNIDECQIHTCQTIQPRDSILDVKTGGYSDLDLLYLYLSIRNIEENYVLDKATIDVVRERTKFYFDNSLDNLKPMRYINSIFRTSYLQKPGGLNHFLNQRNQVSLQNLED